MYEHRENLSELDALRPYLFASFRRRLIRQLKSDLGRQNTLKELMNSQAYIQFSKEELLIEQEENSIRKSILIQTLNKLPPRQREVIYLRYYNDLKLEEIANVMSISYQAAVNTVYKAFKTLRKDVPLLEIINLVVFFSLIIIP